MIPARRRTGFSGGRLLVLLAALAGLFAMHGMSDHGTMRHDSAEAHGTGGAGHRGAMAVDPTEALVDIATVGTFTTSTTSTTSTTAAVMTGVFASASEGPALGEVTGSGDFHAAMGLCLAILAGAVLLALRRAGLSSYPLSSVLTTSTDRRVLPSRARAPDPPDLHVLSIQRC